MPTKTLQQWLGDYYHAVNAGSGAAVIGALAKALEADPFLRRGAIERLDQLTDDVCLRDHISKVHRDALRLALGQS